MTFRGGSLYIDDFQRSPHCDYVVTRIKNLSNKTHFKIIAFRDVLRNNNHKTLTLEISLKVINFVFRLKFLHKTLKVLPWFCYSKEVTKPFIWGILFFIPNATWDNKRSKILHKSFLQQDEALVRLEFWNWKCVLHGRMEIKTFFLFFSCIE